MLLAPENTMPAFELALAYGSDVLEIDVRLSRDNVVMVIHDARVDRTCDGNGLVRQMPFRSLKKLDAAFHFTDRQGRSSRAQGVQLLSLEELFERLPTTRINIDIKDNHDAAAEATARVIEKSSRQATVNVGSFHERIIKRFRQIAPHVTTAASQREAACLYFGRARCKRLNFEYLQIPKQYRAIPLATTSFISHARSRGIQTIFWTINSINDMQMLINRGADGFVTDRVDLASELLGRLPEEKVSRSHSEN